MKQVKRFRVYTVAKMMGVIYAAMGILFIPIALIISAASLGQTGTTGLTGVVGGVILAVLAPIIYGTIGFLVGAISAWLYNLVADKVGGIEVLIEDVHEQRSAVARA